jgi:type IV pilus assembly protein PilQ
MKPLRQLSATLIAFGTIGGSAAAASAIPFTSECSELGRSSCVTAHPASRFGPGEGLVTSLSVVPTSGHAEVVVGVEGNVSLKHFTLKKPDRIVVDISGAKLGLKGESYDGVPRGGITRVTFSQFNKTVVRIVLTLSGERPYDVTNEAAGLRIALQGSGDSFQRWQLGTTEGAPVAAPTSAVTSASPAAAPTPAAETPAPVTPTAPAATPPAATPSATESERPVPVEQVMKRVSNEKAKAQQPSQQPRITITWENASITDVLASLAATFHRTILASRSVTGTISASVMDQPWDVALKAIMNANGFDVTEDPNGIIYVDTFEQIAARQSTVPLTTRTVRLNYAKSNNVAPMIAQRLSRSCPVSVLPGPAAGAPQPGAAPGAPAPAMPIATPVVASTANCPVRGAVTADTITNSVSITDIPQAVPELEAYTRTLDIRQPQVHIKAKIILVDRTQLEGLGLRYDLGTSKQFFSEIVPRIDSTGSKSQTGQILLGGNTVAAIANATQRVPAAALQLVYSTALGNYDVTTFLEAMQGVSLLDVQAEPSATVLNNRTANLTAGTQVPVRVIDAAAGGNATGSFPRATVQFQQTGVILTVTPQITNNRQIQMRVHVENSDVQFEANDVGAVFPKQSVDNEVLIADGETAVMGGLTQSAIRYTKTGIPFLVDLPVIGRLFGVTNRQETKRDLLILITPHIIDEGESPASGRP